MMLPANTKWITVQLGPGGSIPTSLTGFIGPVYPIQPTKTETTTKPSGGGT